MRLTLALVVLMLVPFAFGQEKSRLEWFVGGPGRCTFGSWCKN